MLDKLNINELDLETLKRASNQMSLLKDDKLGILKQDDSFLNKKELPIDSIDKNKRPLLLHYHPLYIYKHQILKQADTVLAMVLVDDIDKTTYEKTVDYYLARTTHDSSLSKCAYGIAKYRLGQSKIASEYFMSIASLDFKDLKNHTRHGLHMANAGGSYLMMTLGLLGLVFGETLTLRPAKQKEIDYYELTFTYQSILIHVCYQKETFSITTSGPLDIIYYDEALHVEHQLNLGVR